MKYRLEKDTLGEVKVPEEALYGAQTKRAVDNFKLSGWRMPKEIIHAIVVIKHAAAATNVELGLLKKEKGEAIQAVALALIKGQHDSQFPVDVFQTGSGTSTNMNVNEVIARLCKLDHGVEVHPNDHVNLGQSSNDVIPSAIHIASAIQIRKALLPKLTRLRKAIIRKASELEGIVKTGRTHLMDAMPIQFSQELSGWSSQINNGMARIEACMPRIQSLAIGGTAVGTGINAHPEFASKTIDKISGFTDIQFSQCENYFEAISSQDSALELSGQLKVIACSLMKISNDLRLMNSGPNSGFADIQLEALQPGSSIMPAKVNPVVPEATAMVAAQIIGNDTTITIAGQSGNFQLNTMLPVIAYNLITNIELLGNASELLGESAISRFTVNETALMKKNKANPVLVTALNPYVGYSVAAQIAKEAQEKNKSILDVAEYMTDLDRAFLSEVLDPASMTQQRKLNVQEKGKPTKKSQG